MSYKTYSQYSKKKTPQSEPIPGSDQVENDAGGYVYSLDDWKRLDRFLILGSEGGTYYVRETRFTFENAVLRIGFIGHTPLPKKIGQVYAIGGMLVRAD